MTDSGNGQPNTEKSSNYPVGAQKASEVYSKSWQYTLYNLAIPTIYGTIGGVAGGVVGGSVGGAVGSIAGPAGTTLGATWGAKIFASMGAGAASKLASTLDREGVGKELEQNIFIYKAHGHEDWNEYFHAKSKEGSELSGPQKTLNSVLDYFKKGDVFDELQDLVSAREVVEGRKGSNLESLINSGIWTEGNKTFIKEQIAQIRNNPENTKNLNDIKLLSELYANLKLKLYDRTNISDAQEVGLAAVTGAAVGGVGGAVGMIPIDNVFAYRAVITGARASTSGTMSWLLGEEMSWSQWFQTFAVSEVVTALGGVAHNVFDQYQLDQYRGAVTDEFKALDVDAKEQVLKEAHIEFNVIGENRDRALNALSEEQLKELDLSIKKHNVQTAADHLLISKPEQHAPSDENKVGNSRTDFDDQAPRRGLDQGPATASEALEKLHNNVMAGHVPPDITATLKNIALHIKTHDEACKLLDTILATHNGEARVVHSESNNQTHIDYCADPDKAAVILDYIASSEELSKLVESDKGLHHSFHKVYNNIISYNTHNGPNKDISLNHNVTDDAPTEGHKVDTKQLADLRALANVIQKHGDSDKQYWTLEGSDVFREQRAIERLKLGVSEMDGEPIKWGVLQTVVYDVILSPKELQNIIDSKDGWNALEKIAGDDNLCKIFNSLLDNNQLNDDMINKYMDHLGHNIQDQAQFDFFKKLRGHEGITLTKVTREGIGQMVHQYEGNHLFDNMQDYLTRLNVPERFIGVVAAALAAACCIGKADSAAVSDDRIPNPSPEDATIEDNIPFFYIRREGTDSTIDTSQITAVGKERIFIMQQDKDYQDAGDYLLQSQKGKDYFTAQKNSYVYAKGMKMVNHVLQKEVNIVRGNDMSCLLINDCRLTNASIKIDFTDKGPKLSLVERGNNGARIAICRIQPKDGGDINAILNSITINVHDKGRGKGKNKKFENIAEKVKAEDAAKNIELTGTEMGDGDAVKNIVSTNEVIKNAIDEYGRGGVSGKGGREGR